MFTKYKNDPRELVPQGVKMDSCKRVKRQDGKI